MQQFIVPEAPVNGLIRLSGADYHYLARVRRLSVGAVFKAVFPDGSEGRLLVQSVSEDGLVCARLAPEPAVPQQASAAPYIALFQALPKGGKMDQIVRQAAEGAVNEVAPFVSAYSVAKLSTGEEKLDRWRRVVREARQQSGSPVETFVRPPCALDELFDHWETLKGRLGKTTGIVLHQEALARGSFHRYLKDGADAVVLAVGPEGGFSGAEAARFIAAGFQPALMGSCILRTETAAVYAVAAVRIILLERSEWIGNG
jgi:16S rRNA (uracil1498-N3)-methyltransferase